METVLIDSVTLVIVNFVASEILSELLWWEDRLILTLL